MTITRATGIQRVIVGDDGRAGGSAALGVARFLSASFDADVHVVHSIDIPDLTETGQSAGQLMPLRAEMAERAARWLEERVRGALSGVAGEPSCRVEFGRPHEALLRAARSLSADLIVLGQHQRESRVEFGGTQRALLGNGVADVWIQPGSLASIQRVIAPVDPRMESGMDPGAATARASALALALDSPLVTLHCSEANQFVQPDAPYYVDPGTPSYVLEAIHGVAERDFHDWCDRQPFEGLDVVRKFVIGSPAQAVLDEQSVHDLVVMASRGHSGLASFLVGGTASGVLERAAGPVLVVRRGASV